MLDNYVQKTLAPPTTRSRPQKQRKLENSRFETQKYKGLISRSSEPFVTLEDARGHIKMMACALEEALGEVTRLVELGETSAMLQKDKDAKNEIFKHNVSRTLNDLEVELASFQDFFSPTSNTLKPCDTKPKKNKVRKCYDEANVAKSNINN
jgi:hypothetical protein